MPALCPICNKDDEIRRLSAIVSAGRSYGMFSGPRGDGGYITLNGSTSTQLARILVPPVAPRNVRLNTGCCMLAVMVSCLLFSSAAPFLIMVLTLPTLEGRPITLGRRLVGSLPGLLLLAGGVGVLLLGFTYFLRNARAKARYATEKPVWDRAMEKYQRLYFCFRDDIVFDPKTGETCQPQALTKFLYSTR